MALPTEKCVVPQEATVLICLFVSQQNRYLCMCSGDKSKFAIEEPWFLMDGGWTLKISWLKLVIIVDQTWSLTESTSSAACGHWVHAELSIKPPRFIWFALSWDIFTLIRAKSLSDQF